jgi:regulator of RNase E activity RraA
LFEFKQMIDDISACEASDALAKLGVPNAGLIHDILPFSPDSPKRIAGPVYTVKFVLAGDKSAPKLDHHFVDAAPSGHIILIDAPSTSNAVWGGLMTAGAIARGVLGVVISGRCRDLAEHRDQHFAVYARARSTAGQSPQTRPSQTNIPLLFGSVTVNPGDYIIADEDGVVCVPADLLQKVSQMAAKSRKEDEMCLNDIKAGKGIQNSFRKYRGKL